MKVFPQKELKLDEKCLKDNLGENNYIFVGSSCDMFADKVTDEWINKVLDVCKKYNNTYLFQTKNPNRFYDFLGEFTENIILGVTIETNRLIPDVSKAPSIIERTKEMRRFKDTMISIEPIIDFDLEEFVYMIQQINPQFVSIGADSKGHNLPEPSPEKVKALIKELKKFTEVKLKDNLARLTIHN